MHISDWSSDVCSSDLPLSAHAEGPYVGGSALYANRPGYDDVDGSFGGKVFAGYRFAPFPLFIEASYLNTGNADVDPGYGGDDERIKQIGRASCRERVCQYV